MQLSRCEIVKVCARVVVLENVAKEEPTLWLCGRKGEVEDKAYFNILQLRHSECGAQAKVEKLLRESQFQTKAQLGFKYTASQVAAVSPSGGRNGGVQHEEKVGDMNWKSDYLKS